MNRPLSGRADFPPAAAVSRSDKIVAVGADSEKFLWISFQLRLECFRSFLELLDNLAVSRRIVRLFQPAGLFVFDEDVIIYRIGSPFTDRYLVVTLSAPEDRPPCEIPR